MTSGRRSWVSRSWERVGDSSTLRNVLATAGANYIRLVGATNKKSYLGSADYRTLKLGRPAIFTTWHGQHLMLPALRRPDHGLVALISKHRDGELNAVIAEKLGVETVRGSAARDSSTVVERGGISGFMKLRTALRGGKDVMLTADLSKTVARRAGRGIIELARACAAPIVPVALGLSRRRTIDSWDRATIGLPFGRMAVVVGEIIEVPADAGVEAVEEKRAALEQELNRITDLAVATADRRDG